ncbi:S-layer homology domain-containing protein [Paenibacillus flagellatus]|nr:S-layer homology domain-containing protein [Paenibacillus flagellatus]
MAVPAVFESAAASLTDLSGHWAKESIEKAVSRGYVDGYEDRSFRPEASVTRGEFVKMAVTALGLQVSGKTDGAEWYVPYANAAVNAGIHRWSDFGSGDWNTPITRQEMARMVVRATDKELQQPDVDKSDAELMYLAAKAGLIQGLAGGELAKDGATTRAQSVTVIERILTVNAGGKLDVDKYALSNAEMEMSGTNIQTMWGIKAKPLPQEIDTGYGNVKAVVDQILIVDKSDEGYPGRGDFAQLKKTDNGPEIDENHYVVGLHMKLVVTSESEGFYVLRQSIGPFTPYRRVYTSSDSYKPISGGFSLSELISYDGWFFMAIQKEYVLTRLNRGDFLGVLLAPVNRSGEMRLTEE